MAKTNNAPAPRRAPEPRIAAAIAPPPLTIVPAQKPAAEPGFEKLSLSVEADVAEALRVAAVLTHRVSASALVSVALRRFLALPAAEQTRALDGIGRRRKK